MIAIPRPESPTNRTVTPQFAIHEENSTSVHSPVYKGRKVSPGIKRSNSSTGSDHPQALTTSKLANQQASIISPALSVKRLDNKSLSDSDQSKCQLDLVLSMLKSGMKDETPTQQQNSDSTNSAVKISAQPEMGHETKTLPLENIQQVEGDGPEVNITEFNRLKQELEAANEKLAFIEQKAVQMPENDCAIHNVCAPLDIAFPLRESEHVALAKKMIPKSFEVIPSQGVPKYLEVWSPTEDSMSDRSTQFSPVPFENYQRSWSGTSANSGSVPQIPLIGGKRWNPSSYGPWSDNNNNQLQSFGNVMAAPQPRRAPTLRVGSIERPMQQFTGSSSLEQGYRAMDMLPTRPNSAFQNFSVWNSQPSRADSAHNFSPPLTPAGFQPMPLNPPVYQPQPIGTPLSATAVEFSAPWNPQLADSIPSYAQTSEPMNYRRLLDRNMSCNWRLIVDKIVCHNDQQASIFLQQKLKVAAPEQKFEMVDAVITQAYPLMINRFGNFLIQRCFEHGTPEQVIAIANTIRGNTLALSMDAFGCHVVQKAFDVVPEDYKAIMVHELLRRIPETVIHRHACHVWQKLFELRWSDSPPQIMKYVNEALRGMWHEVALGETGSLVVQNIFENCLEEDKRPCINEVLANIDIISHGQFGNWCIQHICEHGASIDRGRATDHVLRFATEYSMDQFASKVIEKCLKVGGAEFLERYLDKVCEARPDRPRMPLIDIAGDQYGNYLVQWILISAAPQHREIVVNHVRKHMVSLRGSKFGSRVAMLCCNTSFTTRPGPPASMSSSRYLPTNNMSRPSFGHYR